MPRIELSTRLSKTANVKVISDSQPETVKWISFFESLPKACPRCGSDVYLSHREYEGNDYYEIKCRGQEEHKANLGLHRDDKTMFYRENQRWLTMEEIRQGHKHVPDQQGGNAQNNNANFQQMRDQANQGASNPPQQQSQGSPPAWLNEGPPASDPRFQG